MAETRGRPRRRRRRGDRRGRPPGTAGAGRARRCGARPAAQEDAARAAPARGRQRRRPGRPGHRPPGPPARRPVPGRRARPGGRPGRARRRAGHGRQRRQLGRARRARRRRPGGSTTSPTCYLGEGLGCAVVSDGEVRRGHAGLAGEIAHVAHRRPATAGPCRSPTCSARSASAGPARPRSTSPHCWRPWTPIRSCARPFAKAVGGVLSAAVALTDPAVVLLGGPWGRRPAVLAAIAAELARAPLSVPVRAAAVDEAPSLAGAPRDGAAAAPRRDRRPLHPIRAMRPGGALHRVRRMSRRYQMQQKLSLDRRRLLDRGRARQQGLQGQRQGHADPRHVRPRGRDGNEVAKIQEKKLDVRDKMNIERAATRRHGAQGARRHPRPLQHRGRGRRGPQGPRQHRRPRVRDRARRRHRREVSKKWFRVRDTYGVEVEDGQDVALILAITVALDAMARG